MGERNAYHPTGDARADGIKAKTDELVEYVRRETAASGPDGKRSAALAITNFQQGSMWAVRALTSADAVAGDDGGAKGPDRSAEVGNELPTQRQTDA